MGREEVEAEGEVGGGEDGEGFDEDVGDGFVAGEVRVELVSVGAESPPPGGGDRLVSWGFSGEENGGVWLEGGREGGRERERVR